MYLFAILKLTYIVCLGLGSYEYQLFLKVCWYHKRTFCLPADYVCLYGAKIKARKPNWFLMYTEFPVARLSVSQTVYPHNCRECIAFCKPSTQTTNKAQLLVKDKWKYCEGWEKFDQVPIYMKRQLCIIHLVVLKNLSEC